LAAEIKKARGIDAALIPGSGGQLEVVLDGQLIFSKKKTGRWPEIGELLDKIPATR
jgi:selT/selW/selH-like putative selenoprotein